MQNEVFTKVRSELYNASIQAPLTLDATFLTPEQTLISTTVLTADPKQLAYSKTSELYSLDRQAGVLLRLPFETKSDPEVLAQAYYPKDTSKKAYMVKTAGIKAGFRLEVTQNGVRTHTAEINTPDFLKHSVPDLTTKPNFFGPKTLVPHGAVCYVPNLADQTLMWSPNGSKIMYLAEKAPSIVDIHGKVPPSMEGVNLKLEDYLSGSNYKQNWGDAILDFYDT